MKKLLMGTSALVAAGALATTQASAAGLEASLNGYMEQWFGFSDQDQDDTNGPAAGGAEFTTTSFASDTEVHFNATGTLDNGLKIQYHVELEGNRDGDQIDESYLTLTANWGQVIWGSENSAQYKMGYGPVQFGASTITGDVTQWLNTGGQGNQGAGRFRTPWGSANIEVDSSCNDDKRLTYFTPRFSGFQFGASYTSNCGTQDTNALGTDASIEHITSFGANFQRKFDKVSVNLSTGYARGEKPAANTGDDPQTLIFGARLGFGGFTIGGHYGMTLDEITLAAPTSGIDSGLTGTSENEGFSIGGSYATGPWGVSLVWMHGEREGVTGGGDDELDVIELGAKYALGPGVSLHGSIYYADFEEETGGGGFDNDGWAVVGGMKVSF